MVRSLPLRSGFFKAPELSDADQAELLAWGSSLVPDLVRQPDVEWTMVHERKGVTLSEDRQKGGLTYSVRAVATVRASLDDVMDIFLAQSTPDFRSLMQLQLREFFADAVVLFHKEQNESEALSIKWTAARAKKSVASLGGHVGLDLCVLEYAGVVSADVVDGPRQNLHGSASSSANKAAPLVGVCVYESIDQAECPSLYDSHRLERASVSKCGFVFRPHPDEGVVEATFVCSIRQPPGARSKRRWNRALLANWAASVGGIEEAISRRRISKELTKRRVPTWVNDKDRACCHLCLKTFTNTRRKHHCRACGEIICRACSVYKSVDLQSVGLTTLRVCKACMDGTSSTAADGEKEEANLKAAAAVAAAAKGVTAASVALPEGVDSGVLRDAVEEYALALPGAQVSTVPDLVGIAWLQQLASRDQESKAMVNALMVRLHIDTQQKDMGSAEEQVDIYDTLCDLAAQTLACKYAVVSLVDENRQWFKSAVNVKESEVPRDFSFCEYPVRDQRPLVVMDTLRDPRFRMNPFVTGPLGVRFLAGAPLFTVDNECVGAVCVLDTAPRESLQESQIATMQNLAHLAMVMVQERREAQSKVARAMAASSQIVPVRQNGGQVTNTAAASSSDLVPLSSYSETSIVVQGRDRPKEDPVLKEQMIQLLHKASQVRDQVNLQTHKQQAGLQSSAE
ncbi:hypothetical protein PF005_g22247 [Phytophthora fragariae]|uniref:FYVE-type domain-containing protein n=1 Tax=Phytophthora fragariae TaxID=53985 RepID=A0A6A3IPL3_9STRA|nr:hypothetical protein PF003_g18430 [Phytophthora fragariae]KAE8926837.1 hypothetical protein PF009_g22982 [Phytophthora fragariae]KAE8983917.1 hypothetical protein PF011_g20990 [Phytophthora fragariae]KAE9081985.1 hypothetical protein PF010_g21773 [Phytophthora fragariae]KAE9082376.1 hypothetical protein PF007_g22318 [Phytophthora fragariae]